MDGNSRPPPPNTSSNGVPLPPNGPRRPAPAVRLPSCQIQRSWDRGESSNSNGSSTTSHAAALAARRRRAATVASPIREYPPHLGEDDIPAINITHPASGDVGNANISTNNTPSNNDQQYLSTAATPAPTRPTSDGHIYIVNPEAPQRDEQQSYTDDRGNDNTTKPQGWGAALSRGRRRAATTAAALGRTVTGGMYGNNSSPSERFRDLGDEEATRRARANSHASVDVGSNAMTAGGRSEAYDTQVHDMLDVIDPEVQTVNLLGDIQNAFFIPPNRLFDRTRKLQLTKPPESKEAAEAVKYTPPRTEAEQAAAEARRAEREAQLKEQQQQQQQLKQQEAGEAGVSGPSQPIISEKPITSKPTPPTPLLDENGNIVEPEGEEQEHGPSIETEELILADQKYVKGRYFVLPSKLVDMTDWTDQEKNDLDDYVRHLMHNKKEIFRRRMRGFGKYVRTPLGCFVTVYASLLTFWGAAWVLFLIGWLPAGDRQAYFVEICDQILVALFCVTGLGLIPWRIRDTYHAYYIIKYHRKTLKLRSKRGLPKLADDNDLPNDQVYNHDLEMAGHAQDAVLNDEEQALLVKHQTALAKSHTYYRPHETFTHHAFPLSFLIAIIVLCDCHSCFQLALGSATWSISYHHWYKKILTTIVLCFSLSCNISGGICIAVGSRLSRKKEVVEALLRQAITEEALKRKEDAERYRAEKKLRKEKEEKEHTGGIVKTSSFPINAVKNAPQKLKLITQRNNSDPGLNEKLMSNTRRSSSSARSSLDSPRTDQSQQQQPLKRAGSERLVSSSFDEHR